MEKEVLNVDAGNVENRGFQEKTTRFGKKLPRGIGGRFRTAFSEDDRN